MIWVVIVSVHASVVFRFTIVFVVSEVTILIPDEARINAQRIPGMSHIPLTIEPDLSVGTSLMVDMISIRREE